MPLHEDALWDSGVLNSWLNNVNGIILEIIEDGAVSDSIIFVRVLNDWFLEVSAEFEYLSIVFQPLGGNFWNRIVLLSISLRDAVELSGGSISHRAQ